MKNKLLVVLFAVLAVFTLFLGVKCVKTAGDAAMKDFAYVENGASVAAEEGELVVAIGKLVPVSAAYDEENKLAFTNPLVAKKTELEYYR